MLARFHNVAADPDQLAHEFRTAGQPFATEQILLAAKHIGLNARRVQADVNRLDRTPLPALARDIDGRFFVLARFDGGQLLIQEADASRPKVMSIAEFQARCCGELILFTSRASLAGDLAKFDFTWFIPAVVKYRRLLGEVLLISFALQIIGLATPMFFQVVMDKVLVNHAMKTLNVIAIGLVCATLFEAALTGIPRQCDRSQGRTIPCVR